MRLQNNILQLFGYLAVALFLSCPITLAQTNFSGEILLSVQSPQFNGNVSLSLSPNGIRADFSEKPSFSVLIPPTGVVAYRLNPSDKTYLEVDLAEQKRLARALAKLEKFELQKFDADTLLGYKCFHFMLKSSRRTVEVWSTPSLVDSSLISQLNDAGALFGLNSAVIDIMERENVTGFPMKVISVEPSGRVDMRVASVKRKTLKPSLFDLPKSYGDSQSQ
jgi:hypothetical protein